MTWETENVAVMQIGNSEQRLRASPCMSLRSSYELGNRRFVNDLWGYQLMTESSFSDPNSTGFGQPEHS